nr:glycosyltransferase [Prochlorococcus marinus]
MINSDIYSDKDINRPIILIANSSRYLLHYRRELIISLKKDGRNVILISPTDASSVELSNLAIHLPWKIKRSENSNIFSLLKSFLRLLLLVRATKPSIIHSHTILANLLSSIVSSIYGIPCIFSFAGMGRLSKEKHLKFKFFFVVINIIYFFSKRERFSRFSWRINEMRSKFIFQNPNDKLLFKQFIKKCSKDNLIEINGSGVPDKYLSYSKSKTRDWIKYNKDLKYTFIYCGRLLKSKGILSFIKLSDYFLEHKFVIYGGEDKSTKDSLSNKEINDLSNKKNLTYFGYKKDPLLKVNYELPILLVPSNYGEGLPRSICEALALKIPVISSHLATCGVFSDQMIYIAKNNKLESYIECINCLIKDYKSGLIENRLNKGIEFIYRNLTEKMIVFKTKKLYYELAFEETSYLLSKEKLNYKNWLSN